MKRRIFWTASLALCLVLGGFGARGSRAQAQPFVHPGGLHNQADLDRMKAKVAAREHPWIDDWNKLIADPLAQDTYQPGPLANMGGSRQRASRDAHAAYLNTIRWYISGDTRYADAAIRICNAWAQAVNQVPTGRDVPGLNGIPTGEFALVGEVLRVCPRWKAEDFARFQEMLLTYWYPAVHQFLEEQNGPGNTHFWANWNIANIQACIAIGVLCDRRDIFDEGLKYFKSDIGTGSILNAVYFVHPGNLGQWQESGRDQPHAILGVGMMAQFCEVAWKQGLDLYGYSDNRLLLGAEYVAQWNLWKPVPYKHYTNSDAANQSWPSINGRGRLHMPIWELVYNHYVVRKGLKAPNVQAIAELVRPESGGIDHFGYGTLTVTLDAKRSPYPPSPVPPAPQVLAASAGIGQVSLSWARSGDTAQGYEVRRATAPGGPFESIASWTDNTRCEHTDLDVAPGTKYFYVVAAQNQSGKSAASAPASATPAAGGALPAGWNTGSAPGALYAEAASGSFIVPATGAGLGRTSDDFNFVSRPVTGDFSITARLIDWRGPVSMAGLMMREATGADASSFALTLGEVGGRQVRLRARSSAGAQATVQSGNDYTWLPAWFRLQRTGNTFTAFESSDGVRWFRVSKSTIAMSSTYLIGFAASSNSKEAGTTHFDHVSVAPIRPAAAPLAGAAQARSAG